MTVKQIRPQIKTMRTIVNFRFDIIMKDSSYAYFRKLLKKILENSISNLPSYGNSRNTKAMNFCQTATREFSYHFTQLSFHIKMK